MVKLTGDELLSWDEKSKSERAPAAAKTLRGLDAVPFLLSETVLD
jgi:hypothetical protein